MANQKYVVKPGNSVVFGTAPENVKTYVGGDEIELDAADAASIGHAIEKPKREKAKSLAQRKADAIKELNDIAAIERKVNARSRVNDPGREAALDQIANRPDNAASGQPSYGRIPATAVDAAIADAEAREEMDGEAGFDENEDNRTGKGFQREGGGTAVTRPAHVDDNVGPLAAPAPAPGDSKPEGTTADDSKKSKK